ncbi:phosphotransferase [Emydomyces testavorans]|uniref:Phosphotransferase n=1 Tax=Emydomyces testavorans TaxID=2070801 RepID=A0AAF0IMN6_9EURO|nr:phosphotransferase [Emydomyces testavorans]
MVDGYIARRFRQQTVVGTVIDPMADKTLMTVGVICLAIKSAIPRTFKMPTLTHYHPTPFSGQIFCSPRKNTVWLAGLILARDVGLAISAIYYRWISLPPPKTMARYWDFSLPSAEVKPTQISKVNTALQLLLIGSAMAIPVIPEAVLSACSVNEGMIGLQKWKTGLPVRSAVLKPLAGRLVVGWVTTSESRLSYLVAVTTAWSGLSYVYSKDAVKILTRDEGEKGAQVKRKGER